jgi:hypothetical protein
MRLFSLLDTQYNAFISKVQSYISKTLSKNNVSFGSNTIFGQIISVVGSAMQNMMLYIEDALVEQNKYTAQRKKSIYGLAALSGYTPSLGKSAVATVKLSFLPNNEGAYNIILKNKEQLTCTQNGLKYNILMPQEGIVLSIDKDNAPKYFSAVQGLFETQRFISTGGQYYTINFKFVGNIDTDYITVKVNNEVWEYVSSLYDMTPNAKQYTFKVGINGGIDLIFGNEAHGLALKANDIVDVNYLIHDGEAGNLNPNLETYFVFDNQLSNTDGESYDANTLFNVTFAEIDPITAGSNSETIEHVGHMIGLNSRSLVLASPDNYKVLINRFGFCGYNRTWSDPNSMVVNSMIIKNFGSNVSNGDDYFNLTEADFRLTDLQKNSIYSYIKNSGGQLASTKYNIFDPVLCKYALYVYVTLKSGKYNKDLIQKQIRHHIGMFFTDIQSDMFIPKSDIVHLIKNNVEGVDSVDVYILSQRNEEAISKGQYTDEIFVLNNLTGQYIKKVENIKLYPGENPNLGLDNHGNIYLKSDSHFPILMGGWSYVTDIEGSMTEIQITDPLTIIFEG